MKNNVEKADVTGGEIVLYQPDERVQIETNLEDYFEITPEDIPTGDSVEDRRARQKLIQIFYAHWKDMNPELRIFNDSLHDYIYVKSRAVPEDATNALCPSRNR